MTKHIALLPSALSLFLVWASAASAEPRVIDGDTLEMNGKIIRLEGIDAPEEAQSCGKWACGEAALEGLVEITKGREIVCRDHGLDAYGRTISTCYADGVDIGETLVDKGLALAFRRYSTSYVDVEDRARAAARGVWQGDFQAPWEFRAAQWTSAVQDAPEGCPIKGNISRNGRIYHVPWSRWYSRTKISLEKGERWFCSEDEAIAAGWRAPHAR